MVKLVYFLHEEFEKFKHGIIQVYNRIAITHPCAAYTSVRDSGHFKALDAMPGLSTNTTVTEILYLTHLLET